MVVSGDNRIQKWIGFEDTHKMTDFVELEGDPAQSGNTKQQVSSSSVPQYTHPEKTEKGQKLGSTKLREEWPKIKYKLRKVGTLYMRLWSLHAFCFCMQCV